MVKVKLFLNVLYKKIKKDYLHYCALLICVFLYQNKDILKLGLYLGYMYTNVNMKAK